MSGNIEQSVFDLLAKRTGATELCQACQALPHDCDSIRRALNDMVRKGHAEAVRMGRIALYFTVRDAVRPVDRRGKRSG